MDKDVDWLLVMFICGFALCCAFGSLILLFFSGIFVFELDYSDEQRRNADFYAGLISFSGFLGLCFSILLLFMSVRISEFISKILAGKVPQ